MAAAAERRAAERVLERSGGLATTPAERLQRPRRGCDESEFEAWLAAATERTDPFMAWLGLLFALAVGYDLAVDLAPPYDRALAIVGWAIWAISIADFGAKLWLAPRRRRFLRRHWLSVLMLAVPALRVLRFAALVRLRRAFPAARVLTSSYRMTGTARQLLRSRLGYLAALVSIAGVAAGELVFLCERGHRGFETFGDALTWGFSAVVAMQADPVPQSIGGRLVMIVAFAAGVAVVGSFAAALGAYFVGDRDERAAAS